MNEKKANASFESSKVPMPIASRNPVRFAIRGVVDKICDLKSFVEKQDFDPDLKTYIQSELDELTSNAAEIHLHDIEHPEGGFDLHLSIRPRSLGGSEDLVFKREDKDRIG